MLRGFLSGILWGAVVVVVFVGFSSLLAPLPATVDPQQTAAETTTGSDEVGSGDIGTTSEADAAPEEGENVVVAAPDGEDAAPLADTASAPQPQPETPDVSLSAPEEGENGRKRAVDREYGYPGDDQPMRLRHPKRRRPLNLHPIRLRRTRRSRRRRKSASTGAFAPQTEEAKPEALKLRPWKTDADVSPAAEAEEAVDAGGEPAETGR